MALTSSEGRLFHFIVDIHRPDEPRNEYLRNYYVVSASFSYAEASFVLCRATVVLADEGALQRWHTFHSRLFDAIPFSAFVAEVGRTPRVEIDVAHFSEPSIFTEEVAARLHLDRCRYTLKEGDASQSAATLITPAAPYATTVMETRSIEESSHLAPQGERLYVNGDEKSAGNSLSELQQLRSVVASLREELRLERLQKAQARSSHMKSPPTAGALALGLEGENAAGEAAGVGIEWRMRGARAYLEQEHTAHLREVEYLRGEVQRWQEKVRNLSLEHGQKLQTIVMENQVAMSKVVEGLRTKEIELRNMYDTALQNRDIRIAQLSEELVIAHQQGHGTTRHWNERPNPQQEEKDRLRLHLLNNGRSISPALGGPGNGPDGDTCSTGGQHSLRDAQYRSQQDGMSRLLVENRDLATKIHNTERQLRQQSAELERAAYIIHSLQEGLRVVKSEIPVLRREMQSSA